MYLLERDNNHLPKRNLISYFYINRLVFSIILLFFNEFHIKIAITVKCHL